MRTRFPTFLTLSGALLAFCAVGSESARDGVAPLLASPSASPNAVAAPGGMVQLSVRATDDVGVRTVQVLALDGGRTYDRVTLSRSSGSQTDGTWTGQLEITTNRERAHRTFSIQFVAEDLNGNRATPISPLTVRQNSDAAGPRLTSPSVSPATIPAGGGEVTFTVQVAENGADDSAINFVSAVLTDGAAPWGSVTLSRSSGDSRAATYRGTYTFVANRQASIRKYGVRFRARDAMASNWSATTAVQQLTQAADLTGTRFASPTVSPASLPAGGGEVTLSVQVAEDGADDLGPNFVRAVLLDGAEPYDTVTLSRVSGDSRVATYRGTRTLPANRGRSAQTFGVRFSARDLANNWASTATVKEFTVGADLTGARFSNPTVSPAALPAGGGQATIEVQVKEDGPDDLGINHVRAVVLDSTEPSTMVTLSRVSGDARSGIYRSTYTFPANKRRAPREYRIRVTARDLASNWAASSDAIATLAADPNAPASADTVPPELVTPQVSVTALPTGGGSVAVSVKANDDEAADTGVSAVRAYLVDSAAGEDAFKALTRSAGTAADGTWTGTIALPRNEERASQTYTLHLAAIDVAGNHTGLITALKVTVAADLVGAVISAPTASTSALPAAGGAVTVSALVADKRADDLGLAEVTAYLVDASAGRLWASKKLTRSAGNASEGTWSGAVSVPRNDSRRPLTYVLHLLALDAAGNRSTLATALKVTVTADTVAPVVTNPTANPAALTARGGAVAVSAVVSDKRADDFGVATVDAYLFDPRGEDTSLKKALSKSAGTFSEGTWSGSITVPANTDKLARSWVLHLVCEDGAGNIGGLITALNVTVPADVAPPVVSGIQTSTGSLPVAGGEVSLSATVAEEAAGDAGVSKVEAYLADRGWVTSVKLDLNRTAGDAKRGTWSGKAALPANLTATPQTYQLHIVPIDFDGNRGAATGGTVIVAKDETLPEILLAEVTPRTLPVTGGNVSFRMGVSDSGPNNIGVAEAWANVTEPNGTQTRVALTSQQSGLWVGEYTVPPNQSGDVEQYKVVLAASDVAGNTSSTLQQLVTISSTANDTDITHVFPNRAANTGVIDLGISGINLPDKTATVRLELTGQTSIIAQETRRFDSTRIDATLDLSGSAPGRWDVVVAFQGGPTLRLTRSFEVVSNGRSEVWVDVLGRESIRSNRASSYTLMVGNRGDAVGKDMIVWLSTSADVKCQSEVPLLQLGPEQVVQLAPDGRLYYWFWLYCLNPQDTLTLPLKVTSNTRSNQFDIRSGIMQATSFLVRWARVGRLSSPRPGLF